MIPSVLGVGECGATRGHWFLGNVRSKPIENEISCREMLLECTSRDKVCSTTVILDIKPNFSKNSRFSE